MKAKILVVDDEWPILELLRIRLTKSGYTVITAQDEGQFWEKIDSETPDLLIMDIWLGNPGGGTGLYDQAVQSGFDAKVPVIFISALLDEGTPPKLASRGGQFALFGKPFDFDLLLAEIQRLLKKSVKTVRKSADSANQKGDQYGSYRHSA